MYDRGDRIVTSSVPAWGRDERVTPPAPRANWSVVLSENPPLARGRSSGAESVERADVTVRDCLLVQALLSHHEATAARLEQRIAHEPDAALGHAIRAIALGLQMRRAHADAIAAALDRAQAALLRPETSDQERALTAAAQSFAAGRPMDALRVLDERLARAPADLLVMKLGHAIHFLVGDTAGMRRAIDAAVAAQPADLPGRGYALGCQAFARIESGDVERGEQIGRQAVAHQPDDAWGAHAVAHALTTRGRMRECVDWLRACRAGLAHANNFGGHLAWHEALCHLALGDDAEAIALYDARVAIHLGPDYRDVVNGVTLLHRLAARGHDVRDRAARLAAIAIEHVGDHGSTFADLHYLLALADVDPERARRFAASMRAAATRETHEARIAREVGLDVADAIVLGAAREPAARRLEISRERWPALGGSRLQRTIFEILLDEARAREAHPRPER